KKFYVEEDPRIEKILNELPGANCGGCGFPGCAKFAEVIVAGEAEINGCPVSDDEARIAIGEVLGVDVDSGEKQIARLMCQGGNYETAKKAEYAGIKSCLGASYFGGGEKMCEYACLGFGECVDACSFDAMYMNENGLPVIIDDKCTGCGKCAEVCPQNIIEMHPESHKLFVFCKNLDGAKTARKVCTKACIACGICVRNVEEGQMLMEDNLAHVNYEIFGKEAKLPTDKCPTDCLAIIGQPVIDEPAEKVEA
ncbi:unnamed protein product, partial [marine sediment metagenome]